MNFDDYARHIYQKHCLAYALAIIKSKPPNIPTSQYLEDLKSKVDDKMDDDDITICSDDFNVDDDDDMNDSVNILEDFDLGRVGDDNVLELYGNCDGVDYGRNAADAKQINSPEDLTQSTFYDTPTTRFTPNINQEYAITNNTRQYEEHLSSIKIPKNIIDSNEESNSKTKDFNQSIQICNKPIEKTNQNSLNPKELINQIDSKSNAANMDSTYYDSQKTILYSVHGFTQNCTHYSPSQSDMIIPNKYIYGPDRNKYIGAKNTNEKENNFASNNSQNQKEILNDTQCFKSNNLDNISNDKIYEKTIIDADFEYSKTMECLSLSNDKHFNQIQDNLIDNNIPCNNECVLNTRDSLIDSKTYTNSINTQNMTQFAQNINEYFEEIQNVDGFDSINKFPANINENTIDITNETFITQNINDKSENIDESQKIKLNDNYTLTNEHRVKPFDKNNLIQDDVTKQNVDSTKMTKNNNQLPTLTNNNDSSKQEELIAEEYNSEEVISYKVLEEFNKIKTFVNRKNRRVSCDGYSTDSGYRSDSQNRSNRSALQLSGNWINQSGCCLFNYIMQCPLVAATREITNEIAQVLGQLIDRLHEEEKYPSFLEDLLETVDVLLQQIYEGESSGDSEFLKKDESIQRIFLLNKSIHIQKHSIEIISKILETFHSKVTNIVITYELTNIEQIENISYIFHVLEILLKKYLKNKDIVSSQTSTQLSQGEVLKKSSISDIWRKKWNPNQKVFEGSQEKKCVLKICCQILNKIVVDCVNSYSLVAYSALKCFNSMQT